jgi:hypothetical protein
MDSLPASLTAITDAPPRWLSPYASVAREVLRAADSRSLAAALNIVRGESSGSLRFVEHAALPAGEAYESFIARTGCIPTRDNAHDFFNCLMWLVYPATKRRLNALQSQAIAFHGIGAARGSLRDALTVFDENAAVLQAPEPLIEALRRRDWKAVFVDQRELWQLARLALFGHALMEKLLQPRKAITAHVWVVDDLSDEALSLSLDSERLAAKMFLPLPVLGVPGWWDANEQPGFYDDADVFRPRRNA